MLLVCLTTALCLTCNLNLGAAKDNHESDSTRDLLKGVTVPQYAFAGGQATLSCSYDLKERRLYSLKWYHNGTEFYRYVPTERDTPMTVQPSHKFTVNELFRDEQRVSLSLTRLSVSASGQYRCEVIAEHPSFRTEWNQAAMTVLREPLKAPVVVGRRDDYEPSEMIKLGCQPRHPLHRHHPTLQWYIHGRQAESDWVRPYSSALKDGVSGISLHVPASQVVAAGGRTVAQCRLTLGPHTLTTNATITVRLRNAISYIDDVKASGSRIDVTYSGESDSLPSSVLCLASSYCLLLFLPLLPRL